MKMTRSKTRRGKVLLFVVIALPTLLALVGLVFDVGLMAAAKQNLQQASDAAATAAAVDLALGKTVSDAESTAEAYLRVHNQLPSAGIRVHIPPITGGYAGRSNFVEVEADVPYQTKIMQAVGAAPQSTIPARSVAGRLPATAGGAIVALDPNPLPLQVDSIPSLLPLSFPAILGGLELLGVGGVRVDGAVIVNTSWGGVDENGEPAGSGAGPPYAVSCTPLLPLTRLSARDIRVAGGVDDPDNYGSFTSGQSSPLRANRLAVPDPLRHVPVPSTGSATSLVDTTLRGGVTVVQLPLIVAPTILRPGVYDWIEVISGSVVFQPGIYIIRGGRPGTNTALTIAGGFVRADGVLFYITNSAAYDPATGAPDSAEGATVPAHPGTINLTPSVVINGALPGSSFTPLNAPGSSLDGMLIYQRRDDFRPIVVAYQGLLGTQTFDGTIYAKYGHVIFVGDGTHNMRIVAGSIRLLSVLGLTIAPDDLLEPAYDVHLVE